MEPFTDEDLEDHITAPGSPERPAEVISPEPPKWRFTNQAKKSSGYSSAAAGKVVEGKSSDELGAKYHAPDISLYRPTPEKPEVNEMVDPKAPSFKQFEKEDEEVGELQPTNLYTKTAYMKELDDVGKLNIEEGTIGDEEDVPNESFSGLPTFHSSNEASTKSFKEFENKYEVGKKPDRKEDIWFDGEDVEDNYKPESWSDGGGTMSGVGRLKFKGTGVNEETYDGSFLKVKKDDIELNVETVVPAASSRAISEHGGSSSIKSDEQNGVAVVGMSGAMKKRRRWLAIPFLLLLMLVILLGILLGKERKEGNAVAIATAAVPLLNNSTEVPSIAPSVQTGQSFSPPITPSKDPTLQPTKQPSPGPTPRPTKKPSSGPTNQPTCTTEQDFNLCLAVDMSGSVCNGGFFGLGSDDCVGCPIFGCRNIFLDQDTCCNDFGTIKTFSQLMIRALAQFPAEKDFSIVQFATDASIVSRPQPANDALATVNNLSYTGGITNHAAAISSCQQSLSSSQNPGRKNFIMLITDGEPTAPENAEAAATAAAAQAKSDGILIIPIFISPYYDANALTFMRGLSSDDKVFDVSDFDGLLNLQEALVNQVSCS